MPRAWRVAGARGCPTLSARIISPASIQIAVAASSAPNDHLAARPDRRVIKSPIRRVGGAGRCPAVDTGIVLGASIQPVRNPIKKISTPDDHFTAGPDCRMKPSGNRRIGGTRGRPAIRNGIVPSASVQIATRLCNWFRPRLSFRCRSGLPCERIVQLAHL